MLFGSVFEETPEGLFRMDRLRLALEARERDSALTPEARQAIAEAEDRAFLGEGT